MPHADLTGNCPLGNSPYIKDGVMQPGFATHVEIRSGGPIVAIPPSRGCDPMGPEGRERVLPPGVSFPSPLCVRSSNGKWMGNGRRWCVTHSFKRGAACSSQPRDRLAFPAFRISNCGKKLLAPQTEKVQKKQLKSIVSALFRCLPPICLREPQPHRLLR